MTIQDLETKLAQLPSDSEVCLPAAIEASCFGRYDISSLLPLEIYQQIDIIMQESLTAQRYAKTLQQKIWGPPRKTDNLHWRQCTVNDSKPLAAILKVIKTEKMPMVVYLKEHHIGGINLEARADGRHVLYDVAINGNNEPPFLKKRVLSTHDLLKTMWQPDSRKPNVIVFPSVKKLIK